MNTKGGKISANVLALGEFVVADGREGLIVGMSCIGPQEYLVQFDDDALVARWFVQGDVTSAA